MSDQPESADAAAQRLEAALERIARLAVQDGSREADATTAEISARLDAAIERLRAALGDRS